MGRTTLHLLNRLHQLEKTNETDLWVAPERPVREAAVTQVESGWSSGGSIADWKPEPPQSSWSSRLRASMVKYQDIISFCKTGVLILCVKQDVSQREDSPDHASGGWITSGVAMGVAAVMGLAVGVSVAVGVGVSVAVAVGPHKRRALELVHRFRESCPGQIPGFCRA